MILRQVNKKILQTVRHLLYDNIELKHIFTFIFVDNSMTAFRTRLTFVVLFLVMLGTAAVSPMFAQQTSLRVVTTATVPPRWTALAGQKIYLLTTTATKNTGGQNVMGILAASNQGLFQSLDTGKVWGSLGLPTDDVYDAVLVSGGIIAAADKGIQTRSGSGVWQARLYPVQNGNGTQATVQQRGLPTYALHTVGTSIYAATTRGVYRSQNNGATWTTTGTVLGNKTVRSVVALGTSIFATVWNEGVYRSQDNGTTWTLVDIVPGSTIEKTFRTVSVFGATVYAGSSQGNLYQSNNGTTWTKVLSAGNNGQSGVNERGMEALARYGSTIVGAVHNGIAVSHDNGQTWVLMPVMTQDINTMIFLPPAPYVRPAPKTLAFAQKGTTETQLITLCDGLEAPCGGGGVGVGGGTGGSGGVSGYGLPACNPFFNNFTLTPTSAPSQATFFTIPFTIGKVSAADLTDFWIELAPAASVSEISCK